MPTTATLVLATAMEATATAAFTATARGLLRVRLMPTTDTLVSATVTVSATAMAATVWVTPTASKTACLLPRTNFKGGAASTEILKKYKKVQFQVSKFLIKM